MILHAYIASRPGDSPEVGYTNHVTKVLNTDDPCDTIAGIKRLVEQYVDPQRMELIGPYDWDRVVARTTSDILDFIDSVHEGYGEREVWIDSHTDAYSYITEIGIHVYGR
jgi:hypothetical protein